MNVEEFSLTMSKYTIAYNILQGNYFNIPINGDNLLVLHYALKNPFQADHTLPKQTLVIPEGCIHISKNIGHYTLNNYKAYNGIILTFFIDTTLLDEASMQILGSNPNLKEFILAAKSNSLLLKPISAIPNSKKNLDNACYCLINSKMITQQYLRNLLQDFFIYIANDCNCISTTPAPIIKDILEFIRTNPATVNLKVLSQRYKYSISYISELIHKETGLTFSQTLKAIRMAKSLELLKTTNKTVHEISENIGYGSTSSFSVAFQDMYQMTPSEYRRNNSNFSC